MDVVGSVSCDVIVSLWLFKALFVVVVGGGGGDRCIIVITVAL